MPRQRSAAVGFSVLADWADGYPIEDATEVAIETTKDFLEKDDKVSWVPPRMSADGQVKQVVFCVFSAEDEDVYKKLIKGIVPTNDA